MQGGADVLGLERGERIAQRGVRHAARDAELDADRWRQLRGQLLDVSQAPAASDQPEQSAAQQRAELSAAATPVARVGNLVEPCLADAFLQHADEPALHAARGCHDVLLSLSLIRSHDAAAAKPTEGNPAHPFVRGGPEPSQGQSTEIAARSSGSG
jgi:hypothetical protein